MPPAVPRGLIVALVAVGGAAVRADQVDAAVAVQIHRRHLPGVSLAVIQDGSIIKAAGYGGVDTEGSAPVTPTTLFQAGSISKSVAAFGALRLVEAGKMSLDAAVNGSLRSWHLPENEFTAEAPVTLRELLSHSAGLTVHGFRGYAVGEEIPTLLQVLDGLPPANSSAIRVDSRPGFKWRYSGGGYIVMQQLVIDVTGQAFPAYMQESVLRPLGMRSSTYQQPLPPGLAAGAAAGHAERGQAVPGKGHVYPEMAAAGLWTTPSDLARFIIAVQQAAAGRLSGVLSAALAREMLAIQKDDDGLGVFISGVGDTRRFWHNGRNAGFDALLVGYVDRGQGAVVMINANDDFGAVARIMDAIAVQYAWPGYPVWTPPPAIPDHEPAVTAQVRFIYESALAGKIDPTLYTTRLGALLAQEIPGKTGSLLRELGPIKSLVLIGRNDRDGHRTYRYRVVCETAPVIVGCTYDPDGKIGGLSFKPE